MTVKSLIAAATLGTALAATAPSAQAGPDEYLGEIMVTAANFCPRGTAEANGRLLPIAQYNALFSLLGTMYGGDGRTTFGLPDLSGRTMIGTGNGPGLTPRTQGERGGVEMHNNGRSAKIDESGVPAQAAGSTNMQPYLVLKHCIVTNGIFPSRN